MGSDSFRGASQVSNLTVLVDANKIQSFGRVSEVLELEPLRDKWDAFRWNTIPVDGHDHAKLLDALDAAKSVTDRPSVLLCDTVKGKGISFMEDALAWHYKSPTAEQVRLALAELGGGD